MQFTQFLFPDGRRKRESIEMPAEIEALAAELSQAGWSFEIECFPSDQTVHADCCDEERPLATELCPNGPEVPAMVERLVRHAHAKWIADGKPAAEGRRATAIDRDEERMMRDL